MNDDAIATAAAAPLVVGVPDKAIQLILTFEGLASRPELPGLASGLTIGYGYDLRYHTPREFIDDWLPELGASACDRLVSFCSRATTMREVRRVVDIVISAAAAAHVFSHVDVPRWSKRTMVAFPGAAMLPALAFGALVSLVFNRGTSMGDPRDATDFGRRREMRTVRDAVAAYARTTVPEQRVVAVRAIAAALRSMERLWRGKRQGGLIRRREAERELVLRAVAAQ